MYFFSFFYFFWLLEFCLYFFLFLAVWKIKLKKTSEKKKLLGSVSSSHPCRAGPASPWLLLYIYQGASAATPSTVCVCACTSACTRGPLSAMPSRHRRGKKHTRAGLNIVASYHSNGMVIRLSPARQWWEWTGHAATLFIHAVISFRCNK